MSLETLQNDALGEWSVNFEAQYRLTAKVCQSSNEDDRLFKFKRLLTNGQIQTIFIEPAKPAQFRTNYLSGEDRPVIKVS